MSDRGGGTDMSFLSAVLAGLTSLGLAGAVVFLAGRPLVNYLIDRSTLRILKDNYLENLFEFFTTAQKVPPRVIMETSQRALEGKALQRPWGTGVIRSPWDSITFAPVHLARMPGEEPTKIDSSVVIGPNAGRPLRLAMPIIITGMSYGGALSDRAKVALARAANAVGTATNTGEGWLDLERDSARLLMVQYHRGQWPNNPACKPEMLEGAAAVEIQLGQGAQAAAPMTTPGRHVDKSMARQLGVSPNSPVRIGGRLPGVDSREEFVAAVDRIRRHTDAPVGVKLAAGHHLEEDLGAALEAGIDFITLDGGEGGTHGGPTSLQDDVGIPTLFALDRTVRLLERAGERDRVSVIATGGLQEPGHFLKALALGADAVAIGTVAVFALVGGQVIKATSFEPPTDLALHSGHLRDQLDVDAATASVVRYLVSCLEEMRLVTSSLGKNALRQVDRDDLCALEPWLSWALDLPLGYVSPERQDDLPWLRDGSRQARVKEDQPHHTDEGKRPRVPIH